MRRILQYLLKKPLTWLAEYLSAAPKKEAVFKSLSKLYRSSTNKKTKRVNISGIDIRADKFIIFSDQHKGNKNWGDDFKNCEVNYIAALKYYHKEDFHYINLGDCEELWKYKADTILPLNSESLAAEAAFHNLKKYSRSFGNHDLIWKNKIDVELLLKKYFTMPLPVCEGILLKTDIAGQPISIFLTHGHQGDKMSDNNAFSTWIVAHLWTPLQRYLRINVNTPSKDYTMRNKHNKLMYEWSSRRKNLLLITGHTHHPVFASGRYSDHPDNKIETEDDPHAVKPSYFNTGCCCFSDGDITGIEIAEGKIALIKWHLENGVPNVLFLRKKILLT
jgi:UDP-2,3-diacylglucosamine pyrophosphatase LpxH